MSEIINSQIAFVQEQIKIITGKSISDDRAFSHVILKYYYDVDYIDQIDLVTDGSNDGGIDFLFYNEEENKLMICQSKFKGALSYDDIIFELDKMFSTVQNFKKSHTGNYNDRVKKALQNAIDRLPDDNSDNIEYVVFTTAPIDINSAIKKIENTKHDFPIDAISLCPVDDIEKTIQQALETLNTVGYAKIKLDRPKNYLAYDSNDLDGIFCNVLSSSLIQLYNKYAGSGLFDLNIRRYIRHKLVDDGIKRTLEKDRENFWFLNNGIIIACTDFEVDGNTVILENFSIVNGGQTTQLIGTYKGSNTKEFYIPCKIVATKDDQKKEYFYTKIAEATNSQKPIYPRDLKSNSPEMLRFCRWLSNEKIYLEIKRGYKPTKKYDHYIKNDELGKIILSFALQQPGTARNGKSKIFEPVNYDKIFKVNYDKDASKKGFIIDLIDLIDRYDEIEKKYKVTGLNAIQTEILKNGKQMVFALLGICYRLINKDTNEDDLLNDPLSISRIPFTYGKFISNYKEDDFERKLEKTVKDIIIILADIYNTAFGNKPQALVTSLNLINVIIPRYYQNFLNILTLLLEKI